MDPERVGEVEPAAAWPMVGLVCGSAVAAVSIAFAAVAGPPYLSFSSLNPWVALFAVAAFVALFAVPFAANRRLVARDPERAEAWEPAMLAWGAVALAALAFGIFLILAGGGFSPADSLADATGLLIVSEAGLVVVVLLAWLVSS